jgi:hypothetical protein
MPLATKHFDGRSGHEDMIILFLPIQNQVTAGQMI